MLCEVTIVTLVTFCLELPNLESLKVYNIYS